MPLKKSIKTAAFVISRNRNNRRLLIAQRPLSVQRNNILSIAACDIVLCKLVFGLHKELIGIPHLYETAQMKKCRAL